MCPTSFYIGLLVALSPPPSLTDFLIGFERIPNVVLGESGGCVPQSLLGYATEQPTGYLAKSARLGVWAGSIVCWSQTYRLLSMYCYLCVT